MDDAIESRRCASPQGGIRDRRQTTDVDRVLEELRTDSEPHEVDVAGVRLVVLPGVLSPRLSHGPDALFSKWQIPPQARVLDLGCGCGVIGLVALSSGAGSLIALDINRQAVDNTQLNLVRLGLDGAGEARHSNGYAALRDGEFFDVITLAAPYWDRAPQDPLEMSCFDEGHRFFRLAVAEAHRWLAPGGRIYIIFSDQGDMGVASRAIEASALRVENLHLFRPTSPGGHIRVIWELMA
jgi:methylase of polypeptide subunit release factors